MGVSSGSSQDHLGLWHTVGAQPTVRPWIFILNFASARTPRASLQEMEICHHKPLLIIPPLLLGPSHLLSRPDYCQSPEKHLPASPFTLLYSAARELVPFKAEPAPGPSAHTLSLGVKATALHLGPSVSATLHLSSHSSLLAFEPAVPSAQNSFPQMARGKAPSSPP